MGTGGPPTAPRHCWRRRRLAWVVGTIKPKWPGPTPTGNHTDPPVRPLVLPDDGLARNTEDPFDPAVPTSSCGTLGLQFQEAAVA